MHDLSWRFINIQNYKVGYYSSRYRTKKIIQNENKQFLPIRLMTLVIEMTERYQLRLKTRDYRWTQKTSEVVYEVTQPKILLSSGSFSESPPYQYLQIKDIDMFTICKNLSEKSWTYALVTKWLLFELHWYSAQ